MEWRPQKGDSVKTKFGIGVIKKVSLDRIYVHLLEKNLEGYMTIDEVSPLESVKTSTIKKSPNQNHISSEKLSTRSKAPIIIHSYIPSADKTAENLHQSRFCIDALRFGLVPDKDLEELTIRYDRIKEWVISSFPKIGIKADQKIKKPIVNQIIGQFGDGKSHLMSVIRHIAKEEGYLIAQTEVDGNKVSFSNPSTLLYSLWRNLEGNELSKSTPLLDLFCKAIRNGYEMPKISCLSSDRLRKIYYLVKKLDSQGDLENVKFPMNEFLSCNDRVNATEVKKILKQETKLSLYDINTEIPPLISRSVNERSYTFIEHIIGIALLSIYAGYKGLIILFDEFEVESSLLSTNKQRERFVENLDILSQYIIGKTEYPDTPLGIYFATAGDEWDIGSKYINFMVGGSGQKPYKIEPLIDRNLYCPDISKFVDNIYHLYREVYTFTEESPFDIISELEEILQNEQVYESGGIRYFVKQYVGLLDKKYGPPITI